MLKVLFICGGISGEHEISLISTKYVLQALDRKLFEPQVLVIERSGRMSLVDEKHLEQLPDNPRNLKSLQGEAVLFKPYSEGKGGAGFLCQEKFYSPDVVFSLLHGVGGEDGSIQGFFETAQIPMVGSGVKSSAVCMDKAFTKKLCLQSGLPVVPFQEIHQEIDVSELRFKYPFFVKPTEEGSSLGVSKVKSQEDLAEALHMAARFGEKLLVEPTIEGRELEVAVLDEGESRVISPAGEILCKTEFYSYEAKYVDPDAAELHLPAAISQSEHAEIQELASRVFDCLECRGLARIDFFQNKEGEFVLNEVNTMPGFTPISMYPKLLGLAGVSYTNLISRLIASALPKS